VLGLFRRTGKKDSNRKTKNPHFIYDRDQILGILEALRASSVGISLYFPDQPGEGYASSLVKVTPGTLLLDQVNHPEGHAQLLNRKVFRALSKYRGVKVTFECRLIGIVEDGNALRYQVAFPRRLYYPQMREFFRIKVDSLHLPIHIRGRNWHEGMETTVGWVEDIGPNGIGFVVDLGLFVRKLDVLRYCVLKLDEDRMLTFDLQVRNVRKLANGYQQRIGGKFVNLSSKNAALIHKELARLQRLLRAKSTEVQ